MTEIRENLLTRAIPSKYVRKYYKSIGRQFTDFELAAMLYNGTAGYRERFELLNQLCKITQDNVLKEQFSNRVRYEKESYKFFAENKDRRHVYVVIKWDENGDEDACGYFWGVERAIEYAKNETGQDFRIEKQLIIDDELPLQKVGEWNPNLMKEGEEQKIYEAYNGLAVGSAEYDSTGNLKYLYCAELPEEIETLYNCWDVKHYENYPVMLDYPFDTGDIVRDVTDGSIGIVNFSKADYLAFCTKVREGLSAEYGDMSSTIVEYICEDGEVTHNHPAIVNLEKLTEYDLPSDMHNYILCVRDLLKGQGSLDYFLLMYNNKIAKGV